MLDWPGKIASTVFLAGCNFRCPYCHNAELVLNSDRYEDLNEDDLISYLSSRKLWVEHVVITGGEPTLSKDLVEFLRKLKVRGFKVKVDTNGSRPKMLKEIVDSGLVDFVAMDLKGPVEKYAQIVRAPVDLDAIRESIAFIAGCEKIETEFRLTFAPEILTVEEVVQAAKDLKALGGKKIVIQQFQNAVTLDPEFRGKNPYPVRYLEDAAQRIKEFMEVEVRGV